ncbi:DNA-directed RNA polymerases I, II, and III 7.0 kDa polypeptide, putative, partial [Perkinsus marinus ATCC 50983]
QQQQQQQPATAVSLENSQGLPNQVLYVCGNCGNEQELKLMADAIKCNRCGHRILYKKRQRRVMIFDAR